MRITVDISDETVLAVQKLTGISKKSPAISTALEEYLAIKGRRKFAELIMEGGIEYGTTNDEIEGSDIQRENNHEQGRQ
jgi:Arc/MetJ family transcription regulator